MSLQTEGYPPLYGAEMPLVLVLSDDTKVCQQLSETLNGYGLEVQCSTYVEFQSLLERLPRRPKVLIVDVCIERNALRMLAGVLESHNQLQGCARIGLGNSDKANNTPLRFHRRARFPCEPVEILALVTHALEHYVPDEPSVANARIVV